MAEPLLGHWDLKNSRAPKTTFDGSKNLLQISPECKISRTSTLGAADNSCTVSMMWVANAKALSALSTAPEAWTWMQAFSSFSVVVEVVDRTKT